MTAGLAKITPPNLKGFFPRERLFNRLDKALDYPVVWVSGPAGSGKTTLAAGFLDARKLPHLWYQVDQGDEDIATFIYYLSMAGKKAAPGKRTPLPPLTPEYLGGIPTFVRRYFEELCSRLTSPAAMVFDDFQNVPPRSAFHKVLACGLDAVPAGINVIILSRSEPPPAYARLLANQKIGILGWDELRLTAEESRKIVSMAGRKTLPEEIFSQLHEITEGWVAGLVLLAGRNCPEKINTLHGRHIREEVFDYFAQEVFAKTNPDIRDFLLKTAFLPRIGTTMAEKLTGFDMAGKILADLHRTHFFTQRHDNPEPTYQYHALFRDFLLSQAEERFSKPEISSLQRNAASLLVASGQVEEAVSLLRDARDWNGFIRLILTHATSLMAGGRGKTLKEWLESLPQEIIENEPWLLYWLGVCILPFSPADGRRHFERAFQLFDSRQDAKGTYLAWSGAVQTFLVEFDDFRPLDRWIKWLDERMDQGAVFPSPEIEATVAASMSGALIWRMPDHPHIRKWLSIVFSLFTKGLNIGTCLQAYLNSTFYCIWMGELDDCKLLINEMRRMADSQPASHLTEITLKMAESMLCNASADFSGNPLGLVREGLETARKTGVRVMDPLLYANGVACSLNHGDAKRSQELLAKYEKIIGASHGAQASYCFYLAAWQNLFTGKIRQAASLAKKSLQMEGGAPFGEAFIRLLAALAAFAEFDRHEAREQMDAAKRLVARTGSSHLEFLYRLTEAYFALDQYDDHTGLDALRKALAIGRQKGFAPSYFWYPRALSRLCVKALEAGIEVEYVQSLVRKFNIAPELPPLEVENWPWEIRIFTLGRFAIFRNGRELDFKAKTPLKLFDLAKALIALGPNGASEEHLADIFWPETEGDAALHALEMRLHRLRRILGDEKAIQIGKGRVAFDTNRCWIDAHAFEGLLVRAEEIITSAHRGECEAQEGFRLMERALSLYNGPFLDDVSAPWVASSRERLRSKYIRAVQRLGDFYESEGSIDQAIECFQKGLDADDLSESFYRRIMRCYGATGRTAEAVAVYRRCKTVLAARGVNPSPETESLLSTLSLHSA